MVYTDVLLLRPHPVLLYKFCRSFEQLTFRSNLLRTHGDLPAHCGGHKPLFDHKCKHYADYGFATFVTSQLLYKEYLTEVAHVSEVRTSSNEVHVKQYTFQSKV